MTAARLLRHAWALGAMLVAIAGLAMADAPPALTLVGATIAITAAHTFVDHGERPPGAVRDGDWLRRTVTFNLVLDAIVVALVVLVAGGIG